VTHPDTRRLRQLATQLRQDAKLLEQLAHQHHQAQQHITNELTTLGYPRHTNNEPVTGGTADLTPVERDAETCRTLTSTRQDVHDQTTATITNYRNWQQHIKALGIIIRTAQTIGLTPQERKELTQRLDPPAMCCDNQIGKHAAIEWGDPTCHRPADKSGLCSKHYTAWYRTRRRDGIDTSRDHQPAG
jgi:hypothetical protein